MTTDTEKVSMADLLQLAKRIEAATGHDRKLDGEIAKALGLPHGPDSGWCNNHSGDYWTVDECAKYFTASLDAAMTLVPEGYQFGCGSFGNPEGDGPWAWCEPKERLTDDFPYGKGATPALALCAAALRARAAQ
jgi:hypothetical protein